MTHGLSDDNNMCRQRRALYTQADTYSFFVFFSGLQTMLKQLRAYCTLLQMTPLWVQFKKYY